MRAPDLSLLLVLGLPLALVAAVLFWMADAIGRAGAEPDGPDEPPATHEDLLGR